MKRIAVLLSGRGTNLEALDLASRREAWPARIEVVIGNRPGAAGLDRARALGLATEMVDHTASADRAEFEARLIEVIARHEADLLVLAGFMRVLTPDFVHRYAGRMVNIHPSLLPAFPGLHTHRRALAAGCKVAGATVHFVDAEVDHGMIIAQAVVPVLPEDDEGTLAARVLAAEHVLYPRALGWLVRGELEIIGGQVRHRGGLAQAWMAGSEEDACAPTR